MNEKSESTWVDPDDAPEITDEMLERGEWRIGDRVVTKEVAQAAARKRMRGAQKAPKKVPVSIRLSPEVVEFFKSNAEVNDTKWQSDLDSVLKEYVGRQ